MKKGTIKASWGDRIFTFGCYFLLAAFALLCLFPFLLVLSASFTDEYTLLWEGYKLIPSKFSTSAYELLMQTSQLGDAYLVTIFITVAGTMLSLLVTSMMSYALSVKKLRIRNGVAFFVYFTMLFSGGMVANYLLLSKYLHLKDNIWVYIIPALISPWNMMLLRNFFATIPESLAESAKIDGANDMTILMRIILPIAKPGLVTIGLFYALSYWNEWFKAMLYIDKDNLITLQYLIMKILRNVNFASTVAGNIGVSMNVPTYTVRMATVVATIGPIVFLYPFLQKYFVKGLTVGGVKG